MRCTFETVFYVNGSKERNEKHRSVFNGIRFYSCQNIVSTKTQQGMFRVTRNLLDYSQKNLPVGDLFLRSRTIKMERTYKKV